MNAGLVFHHNEKHLALSVLNPRLDIRIRRLDELPERHRFYVNTRPQLHMTHKFAVALQQPSRIRQRRALKEPHIHVGSKHIHVAKGHIAQARVRTAVMKH